MGDENIEDKIMDGDFQNALLSLAITTNLFLERKDVANAVKLYWSWKRLGDDYISFRLKRYDSDARMVIKEFYDVLGYNPNHKTKGDEGG